MPSFVALMPMYIFKAFAQDWLTVSQFTTLDASFCCCKERPMYLSNVKNLVISVDVSDSSIVECFQWCISRDFVIGRLTLSDGQLKKAIPTSLPVLKLRFLNISLRQWDLVNLLLKMNHPHFDEFVISSYFLHGQCIAKIPSVCKKASFSGGTFANTSGSDITNLFSRVEALQHLSIQMTHGSRSFHGNLAVVLDKVGHSLMRLSISMGSHPPLQKDIGLIASECPRLINLQLNVDCDEVDVTPLTGLSLSHLKLKRIVLWEVDPGACFSSVTHFSIPYDRLQAPKLKFFPQLTHLTLTGGTAPKVTRLMLWLRVYDRIRVIDARECVFLEKDREKLVQECEELSADRGAAEDPSKQIKWIFE